MYESCDEKYIFRDLEAGRNVVLDTQISGFDSYKWQVKYLEQKKDVKCLLILRNRDPQAFFQCPERNIDHKNLSITTLRCFASNVLGQAVYFDNDLAIAMQKCKTQKPTCEKYACIIVNDAHDLSSLEMKFLRRFVIEVSHPQVLLVYTQKEDIFCRQTNQVEVEMGLYTYDKQPVYHMFHACNVCTFERSLEPQINLSSFTSFYPEPHNNLPSFTSLYPSILSSYKEEEADVNCKLCVDKTKEDTEVCEQCNFLRGMNESLFGELAPITIRAFCIGTCKTKKENQ